MASLKEMRNRIGSVKSTQKITKALNMVAAAKLKRAQDQAESARPYARKMAAVIANLAAGVSGDGAPKLLAGTGSDQKHLIALLQLAALCFGIYFRIKIIRIFNEFVSKGSGQTVLRSVQQQCHSRDCLG